MRWSWIWAFWIGTVPVVLATDKKIPYPISRVEAVKEKIHGVEVFDPYRWLEDGESPEVAEWTKKQNSLTRWILDSLPCREPIRRRLDSLLETDFLGTPVPAGGRLFFLQRRGTQNQPTLQVRETFPNQPRENGKLTSGRNLVDPNRLSREGIIALDWWFPSPDGKYLVYGLSRDGNEQSFLHVLNVGNGQDLPGTINRTRACSLAWLPDSKGFYYTRYPEPNRVKKGEENYYRRAFLHFLHQDPSQDQEIFGSHRQPEDWTDVAISPGGHWLVVTVRMGWSRSEVYFQDRHHPELGFTTLVEGEDALFNVVPREDRFYLHTNLAAPRYCLYQVDPNRPRRTAWEILIPEGPEVLERVSVAKKTIAALYLRKANSSLRLFDHQGKPQGEVELPVLGTINGLECEWNGEDLYLGFHSFTVPQIVYRLDLHDLKKNCWGRVKSKLDLTNFEIEQVTYPSLDEKKTPVTMFLVHRRDIKANGKVPTLLQGYGGFNISVRPTFNPSRFLFLERGGLLAFSNLRGGGEYGEEWHKAGMLGQKQNVFDDFLGAAECLVRQGWTSPRKLAIQGASNGGLLVGAALTQRPDLFGAVVCQVPLTDMVRFHHFLIGRLWIPEFGSPEVPEEFAWLYAYSPYHRVKKGTQYPAVLFTTAEGDNRVDAFHARKMAALLQAANGSNQPILLRVESRAGHGAGKPRGKILEEMADIWAFLFWKLGMTP